MEKKYPKVELHCVREDIKCVKCGHKGGVQSYGEWCEHGIGDDAGDSKFLQKYRDEPFMNHMMGFGGTIPWKCTNCENFGLIDMDGLEGYHLAFETIKEETKE